MKAIYLIGARACGKNTVGRILSERLGLEFVDLDQRLSAEAGQSIAGIVAEKGWEYFRLLEERILASLPDAPLVAATGGGVVLSARNREIMRAKGLVVYLQVRPEILARRLGADPDAMRRPSLTGKPAHEEIAGVLAAREALYLQAAHLVQPAGGPPEVVAKTLLEAIAGYDLA